jgi:DNA-binding transcriptional LysR family regulator
MVRRVYDPVTLDQLRAFVTVVEKGSFSAAARELKRVQSAISTSMANLESHLGVPIWDRRMKVAKLTPQGNAVLAAARRVLAEADGLRRLTSSMTLGLEASVSLCIDALFPLDALLTLCAAFTKAFPSVDLRIDTQLMSAVSAQVLDGRATLGVAVPPGIAPGLERHILAPIRMIPVVSPNHPLASAVGPLPKERFAEQIQIVLSERSEAGVEDQGVLSPRTWRVADLTAKHRMLLAGLGWGNLPEHVVRDDLRARRLVAIRPDAWGEDEHKLYLSAIHRSDAVFGPAHRWVLKELGALCSSEAGEPAKTRRARKRSKRA